MAKKSIRVREAKKAFLVDKYRERRVKLKHARKAAKDYAEYSKAQAELAKLPLNSCAARLTTRCEQCGRSRSVYKKFRLCRICVRKHFMMGDLTGAIMSSW